MKRAAGGQPFYNTCPLSMKTMLSDDKNIAAQLQTYVAGFSPAAADVLDAFGYQQTIARLDKAGVLYAVLGDFADIELHPDVVSNEAMGYIFEELLRKFSEMSNETAGEHYTPREVIRLMVDLLFDEDADALAGQAPVRTVYDPAAGTGGMLTMADQRLRELNPAATVEVSGQELNPETWAIARSELMMRGVDAERMAPGNSLTDDAFRGTRFDYMLANPPYGVDWKAYADPIKAEALTAGGVEPVPRRAAADQRRVVPVPAAHDQQDEAGLRGRRRVAAGDRAVRLAAVLRRRRVGRVGDPPLDHRERLLEGIVGLPDQMFYNTGISTYVWIVTNRKPAERAGTVTLVDARELGTKMRKSLGDKRKELTRDAIDEIARLFRDAVELERLRRAGEGHAQPGLRLRAAHRRATDAPDLAGGRDDHCRPRPRAVSGGGAAARASRGRTRSRRGSRCRRAGWTPSQINAVLKSIAVYDAEADPIKAKKGGGYEADADLRDQENIPLPDGYLAMSPAEQIDAVRAAAEKHLVDEIHPYVPDAWIDHDKTKIGYEIPFTRQFYVYTPPRPVAEIRAEIDALETQIQQWMNGLAHDGDGPPRASAWQRSTGASVGSDVPPVATSVPMRATRVVPQCEQI